MVQFLVKFETIGTPVFESENGPNIGYDNIETGFCILESIDDLADRFDPENYRSVEVIGELTDDQVRRLHRSTTRAAARADNQHRLHLNWSACSNWHRVRQTLEFLGVTLYGNFADMNGDPDEVKQRLEAHGFAVSCQPYVGGTTLLRLSDFPA